MNTTTETAPPAAAPNPGDFAHELEQLADLALFVSSARAAMSDEMVARDVALLRVKLGERDGVRNVLVVNDDGGVGERLIGEKGSEGQREKQKQKAALHFRHRSGAHRKRGARVTEDRPRPIAAVRGRCE